MITHAGGYQQVLQYQGPCIQNGTIRNLMRCKISPSPLITIEEALNIIHSSHLTSKHCSLRTHILFEKSAIFKTSVTDKSTALSFTLCCTRGLRSVQRRKMGGPRVFLFLVLMVHTSIVMGLKMNQDVYHVTAEPQGMVELTCATQESPEKCYFAR